MVIHYRPVEKYPPDSLLAGCTFPAVCEVRNGTMTQDETKVTCPKCKAIINRDKKHQNR